jgi:inner membrane protein
MPDKLEMSSVVRPEIRYRGIYEVPVYRSQVRVTGKFNKLDFQQFNVLPGDIDWKNASLLFAVTDPVKGINEDINLTWNDSTSRFDPGTNLSGEFANAFSASLGITAEDAERSHTFSFNFPLNGTDQLLFSPTGRETKIEMQAPWKNPSFQGLKLPDSRQISDSGFTASWKLVGRTIPQVWKDRMYNLQGTSVGTQFIIPVDNYNKTERSVKYALLCIFLTFASFFLVERIYKRPLHLVQYALAGTALVLFYSLLLSISEYTGFNLAYWIAGVATIGLVSWYVSSIMHSSKLALFISFVLTVVYTYIFTIIQLEDYALLMGSIGLFVSLGIIMFFTRKINWENN